MNKSFVIVLFSLAPLLASAATAWQPWGGTYIRLEDDGNVACVASSSPKECNWRATAAPAKTAPSLACGVQSLKLHGITGYDTHPHWCNEAYADLYADWQLGSFLGYDLYLAENPAGDLLCDSADGTYCRWGQAADAPAPSKPILAIPCGPVAQELWGDQVYRAEHWCQNARILADQRDFADPKWAGNTFDYERGWAGMGFGLTGTQRGAPESIRIVDREGHKGLGIMSLTRDAQWFQQHPSGPYSTADLELQDDLFMYAKRTWQADYAPVVVMHIYRPKGTTVSLRMPVIYNNNGAEDKRWPGIWLKPEGIRLRTVVGDRYVQDANLENAAGRWWTLGLKITKSGDVEYYAAPDWRNSPFDAAFLRGKQSELLDTSAYNVIRQADATVMISNVLPNNAEAVIGDIKFGVKAKGQKTWYSQ